MNNIKTLLTIAVGLVAQSAFADISFSWSSPGSPVQAGTTFNATLQLQITNQSLDVIGFDAILEALNPQNGTSTDGLFSIATASSDQASWDTESGVPGYPEILNLANSDHNGFVQNLHDVGFTGDIINSSMFSSPTAIATYTIMVAPGTPGGTYILQTTGMYASSLGGQTSRFSDIGTTEGTIDVDSAIFEFTVAEPTAIPEPATLSLLGFGGLGSFGLMILRARRKR